MGSKIIVQAMAALVIMVAYALPAQADQSGLRGTPHGEAVDIDVQLPNFDIRAQALPDMPAEPDPGPNRLLRQHFGPQEAQRIINALDAHFEQKYGQMLAEQEARLKAAEARLARLERIEKRRQARIRRARLAQRREAARQAELARLATQNTESAPAPEAAPVLAPAAAPATAPAQEATPAEQAAQMGADDDSLVIQIQNPGPQQAILDLLLPNTEVCYYPPRVWEGNFRQVADGRVLEIAVKVFSSDPEPSQSNLFETDANQTPVPESDPCQATSPETDFSPASLPGSDTSQAASPETAFSPLPPGSEQTSLDRPLAPSSPQPAPLPHDPGQSPNPDSNAILPYDTAAAAMRLCISSSRNCHWLPYASRPARSSGPQAGLNPAASWIKLVSRQSMKRGQRIGEAPVVELR